MNALYNLLLLFLCACSSPQPPLTRFEGEAFTIPYSILIGQTLTDVQKERVQTLIDETFEKIDTVFNNWNPSSEVSRLSTLEADQTVVISDDLKGLLCEVNKIHALTEGRFDPTVAPLSMLWKKHLKQGCLPSEEECNHLRCAVGWHHIHLVGNLFSKDNSLTALDLGGIAKGYAVDLLTEALQKEGHPHLFVEWGGEIRSAGHHPTKPFWIVGILGGTTLPLHDKAIATSGNYWQSWEVDGQRYTHIIDPTTGTPLSVHPHSITSTTITAPTCTLADAYATALMLFPSKEAAHTWAVTHLPNEFCSVH